MSGRRMRWQRVETHYIRPRVAAKDSEGTVHAAYGEPVRFTGEVWQASGRVQAELYGDKLPYVRNIRIQGDYETVHGQDGTVSYVFGGGLTVRERDGVYLDVPVECPLYDARHLKDQLGRRLLTPDEKEMVTWDDAEPRSADPDYEIISITPYKPLRMEVMRR